MAKQAIVDQPCLTLLLLALTLSSFGTVGVFWPLLSLGGFLGFCIDHWVLQEIPGFAATAGMLGGAALWGVVLGAPLTGALCLAVATRIPGSIPNEMARRHAEGASQIRIGHASGVIVVDARISQAKPGQPHAEYAAVYRTARRLFDGRVHYRAEG